MFACIDRYVCRIAWGYMYSFAVFFFGGGGVFRANQATETGRRPIVAISHVQGPRHGHTWAT